MLKTLQLLFILFLSISVYSQTNTSTDAIALKIPQASTYSSKGISDYIKQNFSSETDRIRAIYVWIASNINYDMARLLARTSNTLSKQSVEDVLKTRAAVCHGYVDLFVELCKEVGIKATLVGGYTKRGNTITQIPHAWVGAEIGGNWYFFDPTWGAGHMQNNQFVKSFSNTFYMVSPADMIKSHMPFDLIFQFLNHPITNKEFEEGKTAINTAKPFFNFNDSLKQFALLSQPEQLRAEARRMEANGVVNDLMLERLNHLKKGIQSFTSKDIYDEAANSFNRAVGMYNKYIGHKNKYFSDIDDNNLRQMIDSVSLYANKSRTLLSSMTPKDEAERQMLLSTHQNIEKFQNAVKADKDFVTKYISTDKASRKQLFIRK
jgi:hypothetical protein